jgi:uncharacterized protein (TIGR02453 family)
MARIPELDVDLYPPFHGFPNEGMLFLKRLKRNNNREWFTAHKEEFERLVRDPMLALIGALQPHFAQFAPEFDLTPKRAIFRIYRDTRFSPDKTPYKTHIAAHFVLRGAEKGLVGSGYYLQVEPGEVFIGGGIYLPDGDQLKKIRAGLASRGEEFLAILREPRFRKSFGALEGETLKRIPKGFDEAHPMANWLKLKQFFVGVSWPESRAYRRSLVEDIASVSRTAWPLVNFLNGTLRK